MSSRRTIAISVIILALFSGSTMYLTDSALAAVAGITATKADCDKAAALAKNAYDLGKKNKKLFPTLRDARLAAERIFTRKIWDKTGPIHPKEYSLAKSHCRSLGGAIF